MCVVHTPPLQEPTPSELIQAWTKQAQERELIDKIVARVLEKIDRRTLLK